jgi:hypothetical protein
LDFNKLTIKSQEAVAAAQELARRSGNPELYPEICSSRCSTELPRELVLDADAPAQGRKRSSWRSRASSAQQQPNLPAQLSKILDKALTRRSAAGRLRVDRALPPRCRPASSRGEDRRCARRAASPADPEGTYQALSKFGRDHRGGRAGKLDRSSAGTRSLGCQVLSRRTKTTPC